MEWGFLGKEKSMLDDKLKPIHHKLETHSIILEDFVTYKKECVEHRRRSDDQLKVLIETQQQMVDTQKQMCESIRKSAEFDEKNSQNLQVVADIFTSARTGKQSIPWIASVVGVLVIVAASVMIAYEYLNKTIVALLH